MQIHFLSPAEEASFSEMIHSGSELAEIVGSFILKLGFDTDYDEVMISFEGENVIRIGIEDSAYVVVLDEASQSITLEQNDMEGMNEEDSFDADGIENIIDIIASRLTGFEDGYHEDYYGYDD